MTSNHLLSAICSALFLILAFPPFDAGWAAWIAFLPWLLELERSTGRRAFLLSALTGFLFFAGTIGWVGCVTLAGMLTLAAYLALYFGVWGWFASRVIKNEMASSASRPSRHDLLFVLPAGWVCLEYLRSFLLSGFGWNLLGHTQWNWISLIQIADVTGVWGVSFLVMMGNVAVWKMIRNRHREEVRGTDEAISRRLLRSRFGFASRLLAMTLICFVSVLSYGTFRLRQLKATHSLPTQTFKVALLQGNIPQAQKWDAAFQESIWKRYAQLTTQVAGRKPGLIVWPETAVPGFLEKPEIRQRLGQMALSGGKPLLAGVPTEDPATGRLYNSAVLLGSDGAEQVRHSKLHLVPFGEFIPLKPVLGWLENIVPIGDFSAGKELTVFSPGSPVRPFSVLICFEDLFPGLTRRFVRAGAGWLLVITNDGWFGRSAASLQHLQASVFRAVEGRVWIGRAANTGWTGFVDPFGRRLPVPGQIPQFRPGVAEAELTISPQPLSPYVQWGDWFPLLCLGLAAWALRPGSGHALFPSRKRL